MYIGNTQQTFKKRVGVHFSNGQRLLKSRQKSDSCAANFQQNFKSISPGMDLRQCMIFKVVK